MTTITLINPWSKAVVHKDLSGLSQRDLDAYANVMSTESIDTVPDPESDAPEAWLAAWVDVVGPEQAGIVILGS